MTGIEVDITATDDTTPEWTEDFSIRLDDDTTYVADHPNDTDGPDTDGVLGDVDPDAAVLLKDNDLSFDLQQGTLVANYNDTNNDNVTDYLESGSQGGDGGDDPDLYPMQLNVPRIDKAGTSITLTIPADFFNVYTANTKGEPLAPDNPGGSTYTWNDNASQIPQTLWLEVKKGSSTINDITCTLNSNDNGASPPAFSQNNTAVNFHVQLAENPNAGPSGNIENQQIDWMIGQMSDLYADIEAPPEFKTGATYAWSVPGNALHDYVQGTDEAHTAPLVANDMQGEEPLGTGTAWPQVGFFWVSTDAASDDRTVSIQIGNVNGHSYTATTDFKVYEPATDMQTTHQGHNLSGTTGFELNGGSYRYDGVTLRGGIEITTSVGINGVFAQQGEWTYLQTATTILQKKFNNGVVQNYSLNGVPDLLDFSFQYPIQFDPFSEEDSSNISTLTHSTDSSSYYAFSDSPGIMDATPDVIYMSIDDHFKTYVIFKPPGFDSKWVPTEMIQWQYTAAGERTMLIPAVPFGATKVNGVKVPSIGPNPAAPVKITVPPTWTQSAQAGQFI